MFDQNQVRRRRLNKYLRWWIKTEAHVCCCHVQREAHCSPVMPSSIRFRRRGVSGIALLYLSSLEVPAGNWRVK